MKSTSSNRDANASIKYSSGPNDENSDVGTGGGSCIINDTQSLLKDIRIQKEAASATTATSRVQTASTETVHIQGGKESIAVAEAMPLPSVSSSPVPVTGIPPMSATSVAVASNTSSGLSVNMPVPIHVVAASPSTLTATSSAAAGIVAKGTQAATVASGAATSVATWGAGGSTSSSCNNASQLTVPLVGGGTATALATLSYVHGSTGIRLIPATAVSGLHPATAAVAGTLGPPINTLVREVRRCSDSSRAQAGNDHNKSQKELKLTKKA